MTNDTAAQERIRAIFRNISRQYAQSRNPSLTNGEEGNKTPGWIASTAARMAELPWRRQDPTGAYSPPQPRTAIQLLSVLNDVLPDNTVPPTTVATTQTGGTTVRWELDYLHLEIHCDPGNPPTFAFLYDNSREQQGTVRDHLEELSQAVHSLPTTHQAPSSE